VTRAYGPCGAGTAASVASVTSASSWRAEEHEAEAERDEARVRRLKLLGVALHVDGGERLDGERVAGAGEHEAKRERGVTERLGARRVRLEHGEQQFEHVGARGAGIREAEAEQSAELHWQTVVERLAINIVGQQRQRRIDLVAHAAVDNADREQRAALDPLFVAELEHCVDARQRAVDVPQHHGAERRRRTHHAVLFVLVHPLVRRAIGDQLVVTVAGVDKRVDKRRRQIGARRVDALRVGAGVGGARRLEVRLEDVLGLFRLERVEVLSEHQKRVRQVSVVDLLLQRLELLVIVVVERHLLLVVGVGVGGVVIGAVGVGVVVENEHALLTKHIGHLRAQRTLLFRHRAENALDHFQVVQTHREAQRLGAAVKLEIDLHDEAQNALVVRTGHKVRKVGQIETHALKVGLVDDGANRLDTINLEKQIARLGLGVL
jgi:hypothetical protein